MTSALSDLLSQSVFALQLRALDGSIVWSQISCLLVDLLPHRIFFSVCPGIFCQASLTMLDHLMALQRFYILQSYLYDLILLYSHLIVQFLTDYMFLTCRFVLWGKKCFYYIAISPRISFVSYACSPLTGAWLWFHKYYRFYIIKVKVVDLYWVKAGACHLT